MDVKLGSLFLFFPEIHPEVSKGDDNVNSAGSEGLRWDSWMSEGHMKLFCLVSMN